MLAHAGRGALAPIRGQPGSRVHGEITFTLQFADVRSCEEGRGNVDMSVCIRREEARVSSGVLVPRTVWRGSLSGFLAGSLRTRSFSFGEGSTEEGLELL